MQLDFSCSELHTSTIVDQAIKFRKALPADRATTRRKGRVYLQKGHNHQLAPRVVKAAPTSNPTRVACQEDGHFSSVLRCLDLE